MRAIWNGAIGFGLVNIPIKLYSATESSTLDLDMLDSKDLSNIRFKRVNEKTGKEVVQRKKAGTPRWLQSLNVCLHLEA